MGSCTISCFILFVSSVFLLPPLAPLVWVALVSSVLFTFFRSPCLAHHFAVSNFLSVRTALSGGAQRRRFRRRSSQWHDAGAQGNRWQKRPRRHVPVPPHVLPSIRARPRQLKARAEDLCVHGANQQRREGLKFTPDE